MWKIAPWQKQNSKACSPFPLGKGVGGLGKRARELSGTVLAASACLVDNPAYTNDRTVMAIMLDPGLSPVFAPALARQVNLKPGDSPGPGIIHLTIQHFKGAVSSPVRALFTRTVPDRPLTRAGNRTTALPLRGESSRFPPGAGSALRRARYRHPTPRAGRSFLCAAGDRNG